MQSLDYENVVDKELINLLELALERGVIIKILYGISDGSQSRSYNFCYLFLY